MVTLATGVCNEQGSKDKTTSFPFELTTHIQLHSLFILLQE